jgi:hypothetical protein
VLFFFAAGAASELAVFMAGWSSHNKYSLLAAMRALAQLISYELPLLLSVVPVVMLAGSLAPAAIVAAQGRWTLGVLPHWSVGTPWGAAGFVIFLVAALRLDGPTGPAGGLAVLAILLTAVALYYYLLVLKQALVAAPAAGAGRIAVPLPAAGALVLAAGLIVLLGMFPSLLVAWF